MPPRTRASRDSSSQTSPVLRSVDDVREWHMFVEYTWPKPALPKYRIILESKFISHLWLYILGCLSRITGRILFRHAALLIVSHHPCDADSIGLVWELGTETQGDDKGDMIEYLVSYFAHDEMSIDKIPVDWKHLCVKKDKDGTYLQDPEFYHKYREYRNVGTVKASMTDIKGTGQFCLVLLIYVCLCLAYNAVVMPVLQKWEKTEYNKLSRNCELLAKECVTCLGDRFGLPHEHNEHNFRKRSAIFGLALRNVAILSVVMCLISTVLTSKLDGYIHYPYVFFVLAVPFMAMGYVFSLKTSDSIFDSIPTYIRQERLADRTWVQASIFWVCSPLLLYQEFSN